MCDLKPGDEVVCITNIAPWGDFFEELSVGATYTVRKVQSFDEYENGTISENDPVVWLNEVSWDCFLGPGGYDPAHFRKVQRRKTDLTIEAFSVIKDGGFEEPKRTPSPAKKRERV